VGMSTRTRSLVTIDLYLGDASARHASAAASPDRHVFETNHLYSLSAYNRLLKSVVNASRNQCRVHSRPTSGSLIGS